MLATDGPRVVDFGIAKIIDESGTITTRAVGTPAYMAPEQIAGERVGFPADVFAWGSTILFTATGKAPFGSDTIVATLNRVINHEADLSGLPDGLREVVAACLHKDQRLRPTSDVLRIDTLKDLRGKRICLSPGQTTGTMIRERGVDFVDVRGLDPAQRASQAADGSADAMVGDDLLIAGFGARLRDVKVEVAGLRLTTERYGVALRSGDPAACRKINEVITSMYVDGTMERLLEEHLGRVGFRFETARPRGEICRVRRSETRPFRPETC
ncbi:protein kinase domain-containing protein [Streptosporangium sp. OZ121]|uniref:protein kinase domain-containing protein n=1 Tax=Streptosporangium sp. OZ121 TaxID=3444183 RepID=UPI003F7A8816